ncbi:MAG: carboxypeptidase regulatory-like domain-containing protein, partial [Candidatus Eremiobacteraeota bacterium]|nr:carboxypeptidase regulatory-like domain-containing protein [Candidatus Eremiobacteraeota bacterium]
MICGWFSNCIRRGAVALGLAFWAAAGPAFAINASATLAGSVTAQGAPVADAVVTVAGNNRTATTHTDGHGAFAFAPLPLGTYDVTAVSGSRHGRVRVDLGSGGASVEVALGALKEIGNVAVASARSQVVHGSGSDVVLNATALTRLPLDHAFSEMEVQMPGAARGANGVVHINGDHGVIDYSIDGVPLPQELNRNIGGEIN